MKKYFKSIFIVSFLILGSFRVSWAQEQQLVLRVDGLACPFCAFGLEKKISKMEGFVSYDADLKVGEVYVVFNEEAQVDANLIKEAVVDAGFTLRKIVLKDGNLSKELKFLKE